MKRERPTADEHAAMNEREANLFAMCLLMPEEFLRKDLAAMSGLDLADDAGLEALAKRYQVTVGMMALRLGDLGLLRGVK